MSADRATAYESSSFLDPMSAARPATEESGCRCSVLRFAASLSMAVRSAPRAVAARSYESGNPGIQATDKYEITGAMASKTTPAVARRRPRRLISTIALVAR